MMLRVAGCDGCGRGCGGQWLASGEPMGGCAGRHPDRRRWGSVAGGGEACGGEAKNGGAFCFKDTFFVSGSTHTPFTVSETVRNLAAKALIAAARPLAGTISAGSLAAKALIAAARA
jgi:hypothetical protein